MQSSGTGFHRARIRSQFGSVAMLGALWLMIAVICLATIDIGNVFWQKRELQKIADLAALAGASGSLTNGACITNSESNLIANGGSKQEITYVQAGRWLPVDGKTSYEYFVENQKPLNACRVKVTRQVPYFFLLSAGSGSARNVEAEATAKQTSRLAKLGIRTTLLDVKTDKSPLLNPLFSYLLGGNVGISSVGWDGLVNADINLLSFLNQLAKINTDLNLGDVDGLLKSEVSVGQALQAMVNVINQNSTANVAVNAIGNILSLKAKVDSLKIQISQLINLQSGLGTSALDTEVNLFELVQAAVQIGNGNNAVAMKIDIPLGLVNGHIQTKVIEKPKFSAIGDPDLAVLNPRGINEIYVRTAQIRLLISIDSPLLDILIGTIGSLLKVVFSLLLIEFDLLPSPLRIDVGLEVGGGSAYLSNYSCSPEKKIFVNADASVVKVVAGKFGNNLPSAANNFFSSSSRVEDMSKLSILDIRSYVDRSKYLGGLEVAANLNPVQKRFVNSQINSSSLEEKPLWTHLDSDLNLAGDLKETLKGIDVNIKQPVPGGLFDKLVFKTLNDVKDLIFETLGGSLSFILKPIVDPLINWALWLLGIDIAKLEVSGQLNCGYKADLVY